MTRFIRYAWISFGRLLDFSPPRSQAARHIRNLRQDLALRGYGAALATDFQNIGKDITIATQKAHEKA